MFMPSVTFAKAQALFGLSSRVDGGLKGWKNTKMALLDTYAPSRYLRHPIDPGYARSVGFKHLHVLHVGQMRNLAQIGNAIVGWIAVYVVYFRWPHSVVNRPTYSVCQIVFSEHSAHETAVVARCSERRETGPTRVPGPADSFLGKHMCRAVTPRQNPSKRVVLQKLVENFRAYCKLFFHGVVPSRYGRGQQFARLLASSYPVLSRG